MGYLLAFTAGVLFGASDALVRAASLRLAPLTNTLISLIIGTPILWFSALALGSVLPTGLSLWLYVAAGILNFVVGRLLFYMAISYAGAATAAIAASPTVVLASLMAWPLLGEELGVFELLGVALVAIAVYLATTKPSGRPLHGGSMAKGVAAGLSASTVFAVTAILVRMASAYEAGDPIAGVAVSYTAALPIILVVVLARKELSNALGLTRHHLYMAAAALSVAMAQLTRYAALALVPVAHASVLMSLFPLHTIAFAIVIPGIEEKPEIRHVVAGILAVIGISLTIY